MVRHGSPRCRPPRGGRGRRRPGAPVNVNIRPVSAPIWRETLLFRDWLRACGDEGNSYGAMKRGLSQRPTVMATTTAKTRCHPSCPCSRRTVGRVRRVVTAHAVIVVLLGRTPNVLSCRRACEVPAVIRGRRSAVGWLSWPWFRCVMMTAMFWWISVPLPSRILECWSVDSPCRPHRS